MHRPAPLAALLLALAACQGEPTDQTSVEAREAMRSALATRFRVSPELVLTESFRQQIWNDDCLGIEQRRECRDGTFFGYRLEVSVDNRLYVYHALVDDPFAVFLAEGPDPEIGIPALAWEWTGNDTGCQSLMIAPDGLAAIGLCGGPHAAHTLLEEVGRPAEWQSFHARFAPFDFFEGDHALSFQGPGMETASPAWQRAVAAWAALQWAEIQGGRGGAGYGRAMAARRPIESRPGYCHNLEVTEYGRAWVTVGLCGGEGGEETRDSWLLDGEWEQLSAWLAQWTPVYDDMTGIQLYAKGGAPIGGVERTALTQLADRVVQRVTGP